MDFEEYEPRSTLVVPEHPVHRALYPFVEVHSHQWGMREWTEGRLDSLIADMDALNLAVMVNLSGSSGETLAETNERVRGRHPGRVLLFANISFQGIDEPDWGERTAAQLEKDVRNGAVGLKIFKSLGFSVTDSTGRRVPVDDPRIDIRCDGVGPPRAGGRTGGRGGGRRGAGR